MTSAVIRPRDSDGGANDGRSPAESGERSETAVGNERGMVSPQPGGKIPPKSRGKFILAMGIAVAAASLGDTLLKRGMMDLAGLDMSAGDAVIKGIIAGVKDYWLLLGMVLMLVHFVAFVRALRLGPLSAVVPLRSSSYIFTTLLAKYFLGEQVNVERWIAIILILGGVTIVGYSTGSSNTGAGNTP